MTLNDFQRAMLVEFVVREVGPKGALEQMKAVAYCLRNRVRAGWHDGSWLQNIENAHLYAAHEGEAIFEIDANRRAVQMMLQAVDDIYYASNNTLWSGDRDKDAQGEDLESAVGTATYWRFLDRPVRPWFQEHILDDKQNHNDRGQMGLMVFYR